MTKAETKIRYELLIDIASNGTCFKTDQELASLADTTVPFVQSILKQMENKREIYMASIQNCRQIVYPKKLDGKLF
jgi:hypothetical protein